MIGRPQHERNAQIRALRAAGRSPASLAKQFGLTVARIRAILKPHPRTSANPYRKISAYWR
jgi:Mor family transcriptional regulator